MRSLQPPYKDVGLTPPPHRLRQTNQIPPLPCTFLSASSEHLHILLLGPPGDELQGVPAVVPERALPPPLPAENISSPVSCNL